jgi:mxaD protein
MSVTLSLGCAGSSIAAVPELHVNKTIIIAAPADQVWNAAKDFDKLATWLPGLASVEIVSGTNNTAGAVRVVTLDGGGTVREKLLTFDERGHRFRYAMVDSQLTVDHYVGSFMVTAIGPHQTRVTWSARFKRKNTQNNPPDATRPRSIRSQLCIPADSTT